MGEATVVLIIFMALVAWVMEVMDRRKTVEYSKVCDQSDEEYDNDFSKVPAGISDGTIIPPRAIGIGLGVGDKTMFEDLERIGLKDIDKNKNKK